MQNINRREFSKLNLLGGLAAALGLTGFSPASKPCATAGGNELVPEELNREEHPRQPRQSAERLPDNGGMFSIATEDSPLLSFMRPLVADASYRGWGLRNPNKSGVLHLGQEGGTTSWFDLALQEFLGLAGEYRANGLLTLPWLLISQKLVVDHYPQQVIVLETKQESHPYLVASVEKVYRWWETARVYLSAFYWRDKLPDAFELGTCEEFNFEPSLTSLMETRDLLQQEWACSRMLERLTHETQLQDPFPF